MRRPETAKHLLAIAVALTIAQAARPAAAPQGPAQPSAVATAYKTEHAWAIGESLAVVREVAEAGGAVVDAQIEVRRDLPPWNPEVLIPIAKGLLGPSPAAPADVTVADHYTVLADLTAASVANASDSVSAALRVDPRSVRAHESAALVVAAFGLREAADDLSDVRWALNRITAHLAIAGALRATGTRAGLDGQLAEVALFALANKSATGRRTLDAIADRPADRAFTAWKRALLVRLTHDWRLIPEPASAMRIEKLEYFRARRKTIIDIRAGQELSQINEAATADFARIVQTFSFGVEDGQDIVTAALGLEFQEIADIYRLMHGEELAATLPVDVINERPGPLMQTSGPRVLPWGAWAEFFQRHAGNTLGLIDHHYRRLLGMPQRADEVKAAVDTAFGHLRLFPVASMKRSVDEGGEPDASSIRTAVEFTVRAPELVNYDLWTFIEEGTRYETLMNGMPSSRAWFAVAPSAEVPFDAGRRARDRVMDIPVPALEALVIEASTDVPLAKHALRPRPGNQKLVEHIRAWLKSRGGYDLMAIDTSVNWSRTIEEQIQLRRRGCTLAITQCISLATLLCYTGDVDGAVREFERAYRDPALDQVQLANTSAWLVSQYERKGDMSRAYDLAERSATIGSAPGLETLGRLYERRNRVDEAAGIFERIASRYLHSNGQLAGFLYRQAIVGRNRKYLERWREVERAIFPSGMQRLARTLPDAPPAGVWVNDISAMARQARVQVGDIIVAVDGWRVDGKEQYDAIMAFTERYQRRKVTMWRGALFTVELPYDSGLALEDYPLKGWVR